MKPRKKMGLALLAVVLLSALVWLLMESREEREKEAERERPVAAEVQVGRTARGELEITLTPSGQKRMGLVDAPVRAARLPGQVVAFGEILDPSPLVQSAGDLEAAEAAARSSSAEYERRRKLYDENQNVSLSSMQAAEAQYRSDEARVEAARTQARGTWGDAAAILSSGRQSAVVAELAARRILMARVSLPAGEAFPGKPRTATVSALGYGDHPLRAQAIYAAGAVDPQTQGRTFLLLLPARREATPGPGTAVTAAMVLPGPVRKGVVLPSTAVVRHQGLAWVYVREGANQFVRRAVTLDQPTGHGWVTSGSIAPGERIVIQGAQLLLSQELASEIQVGEEGEREARERR